MSTNINLPNNYFGITSFDNISTASQKKNNSSLSAIYGAGSQKAQLDGLTSAIGNLRSATVATSDPEKKEALQEKIGAITSAMEKSFRGPSGLYTYEAPDTRSLREMAQDKADAMMEKYKSGSKIDELI